uniref:Uncharacterized protein n=1 Tax=Utricularia reniformis TaxID=192314 RepID=A0A1Y0B2H0_9LAMI|nr:hypothetical protein AEK19_MT1454 [Utricularia reniformis]ART31645.1 hypothetical protein AEK19_MT1454 [Utricularia reniformis]
MHQPRILPPKEITGRTPMRFTRNLLRPDHELLEFEKHVL